jgi:hypothetical protein
VQALAVRHDTPHRLLEEAPSGMGTDSSFHALPFQRCTNAVAPRPFAWAPTAMQSRTAAHETPFR